VYFVREFASFLYHMIGHSVIDKGMYISDTGYYQDNTLNRPQLLLVTSTLSLHSNSLVKPDRQMNGT